VVSMMAAMIVAAFLSSSQLVAQQPPQPTQVPPPTTAAPKTPPAQQPPVSRPPAEQMPAPTPTPTETPTTPGNQIVRAAGGELDRSTAGALLDRIEMIVKDAMQDKPSSKDKSSKAVGTSGKLEDKAGKVTMDRAALAEILAEVGLLKTMIRR
jgi:hypothetical protein